VVDRPFLGALALCLAFVCLPSIVIAQSETSVSPVEIKITATQFEFQPNTITLQKDKPVRLIVSAVDVEHGFAIEALGINKKLKPKQPAIIEFTPNRTGRFEFACSVMCGTGHDEMTGELVVTEQQSAATGNIQVKFDDHEEGIVVVEADGESLRIDTRAKTVTRVEQREAFKPVQEPTAAETEHEHGPVEEPYDYRLINVPTPKRVLSGSLNLYFTHRFAQPVRPLGQSDQDLFGLDSFAVSSFGVFYGITDRLYVSAYRSPICQPGLCRTVELGVGYHLLDEDKRSPIALSTYASIEGDDNFRKDYTYNLQLMVGRSISKYVHLFFSPAVHFNANAGRRFDPKPEDFFPPDPLANQFNQDRHAASFGFGVNARIRPTISLMFEYTPRVGFKLGRVNPVFAAGRLIGFQHESEAELGFGIQKDVGRHTFSLTFSNTQATTTSRYNSSNQVFPPGRFAIGFNLYRRFLR